MSEQSPEQGTDQSAAADASSVEVPNIREGAVSGLDSQPLKPKPSTLVGRSEQAEGLEPDPYAAPDPAPDTAEADEAGDEDAPVEGLEPDPYAQPEQTGEPVAGERTEVGPDGEATGDGTGEAAPEVQGGSGDLGPGVTQEQSPGAGDPGPTPGDSQQG